MNIVDFNNNEFNNLVIKTGLKSDELPKNAKEMMEIDKSVTQLKDFIVDHDLSLETMKQLSGLIKKKISTFKGVEDKVMKTMLATLSIKFKELIPEVKIPTKHLKNPPPAMKNPLPMPPPRKGSIPPPPPIEDDFIPPPPPDNIKAPPKPKIKKKLSADENLPLPRVDSQRQMIEELKKKINSKK